MMGAVYLLSLLVTLGCLALIDARWRIAFWARPARAAIAIGSGVALLLVWDLVGIAFGVFFVGDGVVATGIMLAPELPIEEPVFLIFLCYLSLLLVLGAERMLLARSARAAGADSANGTSA